MKKYLVETPEAGYLVHANNSMDAILAVMGETNYDGRLTCRVMLDQLPLTEHDPRASLFYEAACLVERAERAGVALTIETRPSRLAGGSAVTEICINEVTGG